MSQARALRRLRPALEVGEGLLVGRDHAGAGAALDRHVADRHAAFHRQRADGLAGVLDDVAGAAGGADLADDGEDDVLAPSRAAAAVPSTVTRMFLAFFWISVCVASTCSTSRRADAVRQRAEGAVRRGVAVAADDGGAGQREALLGADHVDDALAHVELVEILDAEVLGVLRQRLDLDAALLVVDARGCGRWSARCGRRRRASSPARAPCGRPCAGLRTPAGSSPRARDGGRCRARRCRRAAGRRRGRRRSCRRGSWRMDWSSRAGRAERWPRIALAGPSNQRAAAQKKKPDSCKLPASGFKLGPVHDG